MSNERLESLSNIDVVIFALYQLQGIRRKVHTEDIAIRCFELAPDKFSWQLPKYKHLPDRGAVYFALQDARKEKFNKLVEGRGGKDVFGEREGWQLTQEGVRWFRDNEKRIAGILQQERPQMKLVDKSRVLKRLKKEEAYSQFLSDNSLENVSRYNLSDLLNCPPDAPYHVIRKKFDALQAQAELVSDAKLNTFLNLCKEKFSEILNS